MSNPTAPVRCPSVRQPPRAVASTGRPVRGLAAWAIVAAVGCLSGTSTWAGPPWLCSLSDDATRLVCVVDQDVVHEPGASPDTPATARPLSAVTGSSAGPGVSAPAVPATLTTRAAATRLMVNGTTFPLDAARVYTVDLFAPATEREWVEQLARATICYRSPGCNVIVTGMDDPAPTAGDRPTPAPTQRVGAAPRRAPDAAVVLAGAN